MDNIFEDIRQERELQDSKWGQQDHDPFIWLAILGEEVGEVNKAVLENFWDDDEMENYREELVQVAAVCVAAIESYDRQNDPKEYTGVTKNEFLELGVDGWLESETGKTYEVITDKDNVYIGYAMDWGFVPMGNNEEDTLESMGEEIEYFKEIEAE